MQLADQPLLFREEGSATRRVTERTLQRAGVKFRVGMELDHTEAIKQGVMAGLGVALVSIFAVRGELETGRLCPVRLRGLRIQRHFHVLHHEARRVTASAQAFMAAAGAVAQRRPWPLSQLAERPGYSHRAVASRLTAGLRRGRLGMTETHPLAENERAEQEDRDLVARAQDGARTALDELVRRHQAWIYNIAVRMLYHPQDAEDATQEILIKALTRLSSFEGRSSFRTWLYRIVINHVLNTRRGRAEPATTGFECYAHGLDTTPDLDLPDPRSVPADVRLLVDEARIGCTSGMLLCLDREQRLIYILGEILGVTDTVGAELLEISRENFRQRLARARRDLHNFMNDKCGLVNRANPCRCAKKTRGFMQAGYVDPANLLFAKERMQQVREVVQSSSDALATLDEQYADVFRQHPFYAAPDLVQAVRQIIDSPEFRRVTDAP